MDTYLLVSTFLVLAFISHGLMHKRFRIHKKFDEMPRQVVHAIIGLFVIGIAIVFGFEVAKLMVLSGLIVGIGLSVARFVGMKISIVEQVLSYFERPGFFGGYGAIAYFSGMLFCLSYFPGMLGLYILYLLAVCDAAATIFGKTHGKFQLPYNRAKSFEGLFAFLAFALPVVALGHSPIVPVVLIAAVLETVDLGIDDNVLVPLAGFVYGIV